MAVDFSSLPTIVRQRINALKKITTIHQILAHSYPSGSVEYSVIGTDSYGRNFCKIFSEVIA